MRKWNLNNLSDLQDRVTESYGDGSVRPRERRKMGATVPGQVSPMAVAVAAATAIILGCGFTTATDFRFAAPTAAATTQSGMVAETPPLESLFSGEFEGRWSAHTEDRLLAKIASKGTERTEEQLEEEIVESIFWNQQEKPSQKERLSRDEVRRIIRERKLV